MSNQPPEFEKPKTVRELVYERQERLKREATRERQRSIQRQQQRMVEAINWSTCLVPTCTEKVWNHAFLTRDPDTALPLCIHHEGVAWRQGQRGIASDDWVLVTTINDQVAGQIVAAEEQEAAAAESFRQRQDGHIYFVRLNGLIKAGWSRVVEERLRSYGPEVEVLCIYPGTRDDETALHRQLRPSLAVGREWYHDDAILARFVEDAVGRHGKPRFTDTWTRPKAEPIKLRRRSA